MKCACELIATRLIALEKTRYLREEKKREYYKNTIDFCEGYINAILDAEAKKATMKNSIDVKILFATTQDEFENNCICFLESYENRPYCRFESGPLLDQKVIETYLQNHCFKIKWEKELYITYKGWKKEAISLAISVKIP